jgi:hypothetical protein
VTQADDDGTEALSALPSDPRWGKSIFATHRLLLNGTELMRKDLSAVKTEAIRIAAKHVQFGGKATKVDDLTWELHQPARLADTVRRCGTLRIERLDIHEDVSGRASTESGAEAILHDSRRPERTSDAG